MSRVFLLAVGMFALGLDAYVLAGLLPGMSKDFGSTIGATAQIVTAFTLSYAILSPLLAIVSSSFDRRTVLLGGLLVFAVANICSVLSPNLLTLMLTRVLAGAAAGLYAPSAAATAAGIVSKAERGRALALVLGGLTAATVFGVPLGLLIASSFGWRAVLGLVIVLSLIAAIGIAGWMPSINSKTPSLTDRFAALSNRAVLGRIGVMLCAATASLGFYTYLAPVLTSLAGVTPGYLPVFFFLWGVAGLCGNAIAGWLLDRGTSASAMLTVSLIALIASFALFPVLGTTSVGAGILIVVWGVAVWSMQVPIQHQLAGIMPEHTATTIALLASSIYAGSALGSGIGAVVVDASAQLVGVAAAMAVIIGLIIHLWCSPQRMAHA